MPIRIEEFNVTVPDGCVIGVLGEADLPFVCLDPLELLRRQREGQTLFVRGIDPARCDEGWWIPERGVLHRGDPPEILRRAGSAGLFAIPPLLRRGDGRARVVSIETLDAAGMPTHTWTSGEEAAIRVTVDYAGEAADPVVGILIRTRIGMEVYGTNTELEGIRFGPVRAGDCRWVSFAFACNLCPQEYTITAASHDPDGTWHEWIEDAVAFRVVDSRYTAGVANLRAKVSVA
jgi:lipopolysaccharide transport system ATP-binding protein